MKNYKNIGTRNKLTPQTEPIPGTVKNEAGGYSFKVDNWTKLDRFLILGTEKGTFYASEKKHTAQAAKSVEECIKENGQRVVNRIVEISESGKAHKNDPAILALAMCAGQGDDETRRAALAALPKVCRTGTHVLHFAGFIEQFRGWGRSLRNGIANWYNAQDTEKLAYQVTKYAQRDGWSHMDLLRLSHPRSEDKTHTEIYKYVVGKGLSERQKAPDAIKYLQAVEAAKHETSAKKLIELINEYNLPREVLPTESLTKPEIWEALLQKMPVTAMIRNLGKMTNVGILSANSAGSRRVIDVLGNKDILRKGRVHPIAVLAAMKTYAQGHGERGSLSWKPTQQIIDVLDSAFYATFDNVEPTNKRFMIGLDISGSMFGSPVSGVPGLDAATASCAMSLITAATEKHYEIMAFTTQFEDAGISPRMRLDSVLKHAEQLSYRMGGTDCALPVKYALKNKIPVDTFIIWTDSQTWAGIGHPVQALKEYRQKMGIPAKMVVACTTANDFSIADPNDRGMLDIVGFSPDVPSVIHDFVLE